MTDSTQTDEKHEHEIARIREALRRLTARLPGVLRYRFENTLDHVDRSFALLSFDREMASFRAITAEEEAATALIKCLQQRRYPFADKFKSRDHQHKAAVLACVAGMTHTVRPILQEFQLIFDVSKPSIDVKLPLSNFGVAGGENFAIQPVEPLEMVHAKDGVPETELCSEALKHLAEQSSFETVKEFVAAQANARNTLLYASDCKLPVSRATAADLRKRRDRALALLILTVMVWQKKGEQALVRQAILAFLGVMSRLPEPS